MKKILIALALPLGAALFCLAPVAHCEEAAKPTAATEPTISALPAVKNDPKLDRQLLDALRENEDETEAREALGAGANPNAAGKDGVTALMLATQNGKVDLVQKLLVFGAQPNAVNKNQQSALHLATTIGAPKPKKKRFGGLGGILGGAAMGAALGGGLGDFGAGGVWAGNLLGSAGLDSLLGANLDGFLHGGVFNLTGRLGWNVILGTAMQGDLRANGLYGMQNMLSYGSLGGLGAGGRLGAANWIGLASAVNSSNPKVLGVMSNLPSGDPRWSQFMSAAAAGNRAAVDGYLADPTMRPLFDQAEQGFASAANELPGNAARTIIKSLLDKGANASLRDKSGKTAADLAKDRGWDDVVTMLNAKPAAPVVSEAAVVVEKKEELKTEN